MLKKKADQIRYDLIRIAIKNGAGHIAPSLSCVDILTALYYRVLDIRGGLRREEKRPAHFFEGAWLLRRLRDSYRSWIHRQSMVGRFLQWESAAGMYGAGCKSRNRGRMRLARSRVTYGDGCCLWSKTAEQTIQCLLHRR